MSKMEIITLNGENEKKLDFELIAEVLYQDYNYLILRPIQKYKDLDPDMAMVFRVESGPDGDHYELEFDDEIIDAVGEIYNSEIEEK